MRRCDLCSANIPDEELPYVGDARQKCLCVKGVPSDWDEWRIFEIFREFGIINNITLTKNVENRQRGYCFVEMMTLASVSKIMHQLDESGRLKVPGLKILLDIQLARSKESLPKFGLEKGNRGETVLRNRLDNNAPFLHKSSSFPVVPTDGGGDRKAVVIESKSEEDERLVDDGSIRDPYKGWMSYLDPHFRPPPAHGEFPAIRFNPNIHRYPDIPMGKLIPVTIAVSHKIMRNSPPLFHVQLKNVDSEQENELRKVLEKHFTKTDPLEHVEEGELVIVKDTDDDQSALRQHLFRAIVNEVRSAQEVVVFCFHTAKSLTVPLRNMRPFHEDFAKVPFKSIPCSFYGLSNPTDQFIDRVVSQLSGAKGSRNVPSAIKLVSFKGFINLVQLFIMKDERSTDLAVDFMQTLSDSGVCTYTPPTKQRKVYSREQILSMRVRKNDTIPQQ